MNGYYSLMPTRLVHVTGGPEAGTEYNLDVACKKCGSGALVVGPLLLPAFRQPKEPVFQTLTREVLVSSKVGSILREVGVDCLQEVRNARTRELVAYFELRPSVVLPPFSDRTVGIERENPCPVCKRDGFFGIPYTALTLVYQEKDRPSFSESKVMATFERFGNSVLREPFCDSVFAAPRMIIDSDVYDALRDNGVLGVEFEPVLII